MYQVHPNLLLLGHAFDVCEPRPLFDAGITPEAALEALKSLEINGQLWNDVSKVFYHIQKPTWICENGTTGKSPCKSIN